MSDSDVPVARDGCPCGRTDEHGPHEYDTTPPVPPEPRWAVDLIDCGRDDGVQVCATWAEADEFRQSYIQPLKLVPNDCERNAIIHRASPGTRLGYHPRAPYMNDRREAITVGAEMSRDSTRSVLDALLTAWWEWGTDDVSEFLVRAVLPLVAAREAAAQAENERPDPRKFVSVEDANRVLAEARAERDAAYRAGLDAAVKAIEALRANPDQQSEQVARTRGIGLLMAARAVRALDVPKENR